MNDLKLLIKNVVENNEFVNKREYVSHTKNYSKQKLELEYNIIGIDVIVNIERIEHNEMVYRVYINDDSIFVNDPMEIKKAIVTLIDDYITNVITSTMKLNNTAE